MLKWVCTSILMAAIPLALVNPASAIDHQALSRYPTADETYYVLACMDMNGQNAEGLHKCSCAINALEAKLPYQDYSDAELVLAMRQAGGRNAAIFRDTAPMKEIVGKFLGAQSEANRECFGAPTDGEPGQASRGK